MHEDTRKRMNELMELIEQSEDFSVSTIETEEFLYGSPYGAEKDYEEAEGISADFTVTVHSPIEVSEESDENDFRIK